MSLGIIRTTEAHCIVIESRSFQEKNEDLQYHNRSFMLHSKISQKLIIVQDLTATTHDDMLFLINLKIRTLKAALENGAPTQSIVLHREDTRAYRPTPDDPFFFHLQ